VCDASGGCANSLDWGRALGDSGHQEASDATWLANGGVALTGLFTGRLGDDHALVAGDVAEGFVMALAADGAVRWSATLGPGSRGDAVAQAADGSLLVAASFTGTLQLGDATMQADGVDAFVAKIDDGGRPAWVQQLGGAGEQRVRDLATAADGAVWVVGAFQQQLAAEATALTSAGGSDAFVMRLDGDGSPRWTRALHSGGNNVAHTVTPVADGAVVGGSYNQPANFDGQSLHHAAQEDAFVAALNADGSTRWLRSFGGSGSDVVRSIAADAQGQLALAAFFTKEIDVGGPPHYSAGCEDLLVARLDADGEHLWSVAFGSEDAEVPRAIAVDSQGGVVVAGAFYGILDFGAGPMTSAGDGDGFVLKLGATGTHRWSRQLGDAGRQSLVAVAVDAADRLLLGGSFEGTLDFGGIPLASAGARDVLAAKLAP
jgi:hypothetical protein